MQSDAETPDLSFSWDDSCATLPRNFSGLRLPVAQRTPSVESSAVPRGQREAIVQAFEGVQMASPSLSDLAAALALRLRMPIRMRTAKGPVLRHGLQTPQLPHAFIIINHPKQGSEALIIDPAFREQFRIGLHDAVYSKQLEEQVPELFIGSASEMAPLLRKVVRWMHAAFTRNELSIPFWRKSEAVMSLWLPAEFSDQLFTLASAEPSQHQPKRKQQQKQPEAPASPFVVCKPAPTPFSAAAGPLPLFSSARPRVQPPLAPLVVEPKVVVKGFDLTPSLPQAHEERPQIAFDALRANTFSQPLSDRLVHAAMSPAPHGTLAIMGTSAIAPVRSISAPLSLTASRRSAASIKAQ